MPCLEVPEDIRRELLRYAERLGLSEQEVGEMAGRLLLAIFEIRAVPDDLGYALEDVDPELLKKLHDATAKLLAEIIR